MSDQADTNEMLVTLTADIVGACQQQQRRDFRSRHADRQRPCRALGPRQSAGGGGKAGSRRVDPILDQARLHRLPRVRKKLKMLRRHLMTHYGMTPDDYRAKWGLPADYPMVAPEYAEKRRALAKQIGLGTKGRGGGRKRRKA